MGTRALPLETKKPTTFKTLADIPLAVLKHMGLKAVILDVDNTLMPYDSDEVPDNIRSWVEEAKKHFIVLSVGNTRPRRARLVRQQLGIPAFALSMKPFPWAWWRVRRMYRLTPSATVLIGDQFFTDALFAAIAGIKFIRVKPLSTKDALHTRITRWLEKKLFP